MGKGSGSGIARATTTETHEAAIHALNQSGDCGCVDFSCLTPPRSELLRNHKNDLADTVGRLRRRLDPEPGGYTEHLLNRISSRVEALHLLVEPSAGQLAACAYPGDPAAADAAIGHVDAAWTRLQQRLRPKVAR